MHGFKVDSFFSGLHNTIVVELNSFGFLGFASFTEQMIHLSFDF